MDWSTDLASWPLAQWSSQIICKHRWHVQMHGSGPDMLVLHGTGGSTHSWREVLPELAQAHRVIALDLPGHGFTTLGAPRRSSLSHMSTDLARLCTQQDWHPKVILAHSAGCALALHMLRYHWPQGQPAPLVIGINPALSKFDGLAGWLFPAMARLLAAAPFTASLFAVSSDPLARARKLIRGTGSELSDDGYALYARLIADRQHIDGALQMMAQWDLDPLLRVLQDIHAPCHFLIGEGDTTVAPHSALPAIAKLPDAQVHQIEGLGHLLHEEAPSQTVARITALLKSTRG